MAVQVTDFWRPRRQYTNNLAAGNPYLNYGILQYVYIVTVCLHIKPAQNGWYFSLCCSNGTITESWDFCDYDRSSLCTLPLYPANAISMGFPHVTGIVQHNGQRK